MLKRDGGKVLVEYVGFNSLWTDWVEASLVSPVDLKLELSRRINADLAGGRP